MVILAEKGGMKRAIFRQGAVEWRRSAEDALQLQLAIGTTVPSGNPFD